MLAVTEYTYVKSAALQGMDMLKKVSPFKASCQLIVAFYFLLVFTPLATMAFQSKAPPATPAAVTQKVQPEPEPQQLSANYLDTDKPPTTPPPGNIPLYDTLTISERRKAGLPTAIPQVTPYYGDRVVYLTFDDGPDPDNTPAVLKILQTYHIKATFFVIGSEAEKHPDLVKSIYQQGHAIGNHTYSHVYRDIYKSAATYTAQLQRTDDIIKNITGARPRISRAPGGSAGSFTKEYWENLKSLGYMEVGWNISSGDASRSKAPQLAANIAKQVETNKFLWSHAIVLMHDGRGHEETIKALPEIIHIFKNLGFEFRVVNLETPPAW